MPGSLAICVAGWRFTADVYRRLQAVEDADLYVVAHRPVTAVPADLFTYVPRQNVLFAPNLGYDWGCYQQFLEWAAWQEYATICFMHDDVEIRSGQLFERCRGLLGGGCSVVGNGRVAARQAWPRLAPHSYAHASWLPDPDFVHDVVRGSFFMTTRPALVALDHFEVYWDPWRLTSGFGNWSTKATCAKWEARLGPDCFGFLSESYLSSPYLVEHVRGEAGNLSVARLTPAKRQLVRLIEATARRYVEARWRACEAAPRSLRVRTLGRLLKIFSERRPAAGMVPTRGAEE